MNHGLTRVDRYGMRARTPLPWRAHCHVCCRKLLEVAEELLAPGVIAEVAACSWYFAKDTEAREYVLAHLASHVEVPA